MSFITQNSGQFPYFNLQLGAPVWQGKRVLDFGGNIGNVLHHPTSTIEHEKYWCLDVCRDAIEMGKRAAPSAHFVFYDRYNPEYNPLGKKALPLPTLEAAFDFILALSVFTHTPRGEMIDLVSQLRRLLNSSGRMAFTFLSPHYVPPDSKVSNLKYYCEQRLDPPLMPVYFDDAKLLQDLTWCTLAAGALATNSDGPAISDASETDYLVFYTPEYLTTIFPDAEIRYPVAPFARQHCCIFTHA
jgi:SAM-dependent methyltransferase